MKVTNATPLITFGIAALAVTLSFQVHAQGPDHTNVSALQTATGQYITPTACSNRTCIGARHTWLDRSTKITRHR
jgi:hypothetical protein